MSRRGRREVDVTAVGDELAADPAVAGPGPRRSRAAKSGPPPSSSSGGKKVKATKVAEIARDAGLGAAGASTLASMQPESDEEARELAELFKPNTADRISQAGPARSPGRQFVESGLFRQVASHFEGAPRGVSWGELGLQLEWQPVRGQTSSDEYYPVARDTRRDRFVAMSPTRARVPALVNVVDDVEGELITVASEDSRTDNAGGTPRGAQLPESHIDFTGVEHQLARWGTHATFSVDAFRDPGAARAAVDRFVRDASMRALETDMLVGDGSETSSTRRLLGVINTSGVSTVSRDDAESEDRLDALVRGGVTVLNAEFAPPLAAVIHPTDLQTLILERNTNDALQRVMEVLELAGINELVPSTRVTQGTTVVGAWPAAATLYQKGAFQLLFWNQHADYASRRLMLVELSAPVQFDVDPPGGFCLVTNL